MTAPVHLLIVDPQNDFCDLPAAWRGSTDETPEAPTLPVAGAHADMLRLAVFIRSAVNRLDEITVTLDSHQRLDIAHPGFWQRRDGSDVSPFTPITAAQLVAGEFRTRRPEDQPRALAYARELEARGRYTLMVWPVHCEIGSWGHSVHPAVRHAYNHWEISRQRSVHKVLKGLNPWTEHYSALQAEVPDPSDPGTLLNQDLLHRLGRSGLLFVAGEASSHCVKATVEDLVSNWSGGRAERVVLLSDAMSPVAGFQAQHDAFVRGMETLGARWLSCQDALHLLQT